MRFAGVQVNSSLLDSVAYDIDSSLLELVFCDGAIYQYAAVPEAIYQELVAADSKGSYFNRQIRSRFLHVRIQAPQ